MSKKGVVNVLNQTNGFYSLYTRLYWVKRACAVTLLAENALKKEANPHKRINLECELLMHLGRINQKLRYEVEDVNTGLGKEIQVTKCQ